MCLGYDSVHSPNLSLDMRFYQCLTCADWGGRIFKKIVAVVFGLELRLSELYGPPSEELFYRGVGTLATTQASCSRLAPAP